ncbi:MAG: S8 family serine peptidase [Bacteroidota bacterium]
MHYRLLIFISGFLLLSCHSTVQKKSVSIDAKNLINKTSPLSEKEILSWPIKDIVLDTIPGISLERAYSELLLPQKGDTIVIALIDMPVDINHPDLNPNIWRNADEIPNNSIDDDANGYIDDIQGWNFMGNPDGRNYVFMNYEYTRILKKYDYHPDRSNNTTQINFENPREHQIFQKAVAQFNERKEFATYRIKKTDSLNKKYWKQKQFILEQVQKDTFSMEDLNNLEKKYADSPEVLSTITAFKKNVSLGINDQWLKNALNQAEKRLEVMLGLDFDDRLVTGDDVTNPKDIHYGNSMVNHNLNVLDHGTRMAGVLVSSFESKKLEALMNHIKIMPLCVSGLGDENDKDMALAIRYAVDNGARVINISSGKYFSLNEDWVEDAIKYANENDVLVVASSGNRGVDLDDFENMKYPNDIDVNGNEFANNFIRVGSSGYVLDSTFVHPATNYGKTEVDIFAPGEKIRTTTAKKEAYTFSYGTSASAAMVSKVAAVVLIYYPSLTASELKEAILKSGIQYEVLIPKKEEEDNKEKTPFSALSKTGAVVNAYNAILLAEEKLNENKN